uniref:Uncharacterized phage-associated protein n=1 Tax=Candidatus Kentrum sp. DK TaxID=2126562 RepID=A0A450TAW2_9GAMM|nr:MAG: Uncharacterized phage-associated protein [Candidatus Kentron sp. DK]
MSHAAVFDVAHYILKECGPMSAMKLQKLVYYAQAWALVWDDEPLFDEDIEAWSNGPVVRELYNEHRGLCRVDPGTFAGTAEHALTENQKDTINTVIRAYGDKSPQWLSDQTHMEQPWIAARSGLPDNIRGNQVITLESLAEYYGSL